MTTYRARIFDFLREPMSNDDLGAYRFFEDGILVVENGRITYLGDYDPSFVIGKLHDYRPFLLAPGFIDLHLHMPQMQVIASYAAELLDWLNDHTFPTESRFENPQLSSHIAEKLIETLLNHGTTSAVAYCTSHPNSVDAYFEAAAKRNMCMIGGKVMMDRGAPATLLDTPERGYAESKSLIEKWHGKGRAHYAITPRFAITSSPEQMETVKVLARENPNCYIQTHIDENHAEIALTKELYPKAIDYMDVYARYELLGSKTLLGHCIHMTEREISVMIESESIAVHCPTSNLFLGSGLFKFMDLRAKGAKLGLATDIGGGSSYSMLRTMDEAYKISQLQGRRLSPLLSFYTSTLGNAIALGLEKEIGNLDINTYADFILLDVNATPHMALRAERIRDIRDELFILQTLGDDRAVKAVFIAGKCVAGMDL